MTDPYAKNKQYGNMPLIGFDFKLLYGNLNKMDESSFHSQFVFGDPDERKEIEDSISIKEFSHGKCYHFPGETCSVESSYGIEADVDTSKYTYNWYIISGSVEMISDPEDSDIIIRSNDISSDSTFTIGCNIINDMYEQKTLTASFTHEVEIIERIVITSLDELNNTPCEFEITDKCVASSLYKVSATNVDTYQWSIDGDAYIVGGQGTNTISVESNTDYDTSFTVTCICSNILDTQSISGSYLHDRTEIVVKPIILNGIIEKTQGECIYHQGQTCVANGVYEADVLYATIYDWEITSGSAIIVSGQGTKEVVVQSNSDTDTDFDLKVTCSNSQFPSKSTIETFTHERTYEYVPDIVISSLEELQSGFCNYDNGDTCVAQSSYKVTQTGGDDYTWDVTNATIISGQGTDTIVVETTGSSDIMFNVKCTVTNALYSESINRDYVHTREENDIFDRHTTYDSNNIAEEFVA